MIGRFRSPESGEAFRQTDGLRTVECTW
jgi:hypothetical protein